MSFSVTNTEQKSPTFLWSLTFAYFPESGNPVIFHTKISTYTKFGKRRLMQTWCYWLFQSWGANPQLANSSHCHTCSCRVGILFSIPWSRSLQLSRMHWYIQTKKQQKNLHVISWVTQPTVLKHWRKFNQKLEMWANGQRDGRPALTPTTKVPCSNDAKMRNPLKLAGVPQTNETISVASGPSSPYYKDT